MSELTKRERKCLEFLEPRIRATAAAIGEVVAPEIRSAWNQAHYGVVITASLERRDPPLVELARPALAMCQVESARAWRITDAGRAALKESVP